MAINTDFASEYSELLNKKDYRGLANLLSNTQFNDYKTRQEANRLIEKFEEQANIDDKLLERADDNTRKAYNFITNGPSKEDMSNENSPSYKFMTAWNNMADKNGNISFNFNNETEYNKFISELGGNEKNIKDIGINLSSNYGVSFATDIKDKIQIFNAIKKSGIIEGLNIKRMGLAYNDPGILKQNKASVYLPENQQRILDNFNKMNSVVQEANSLYNTIFENTKPYLSETIVTGYMGEDDKKLQQYFSNGLIDLPTFKELRNVLEEKYNRVLTTMDLTQYDVFSMNEDNNGSHVLQPLKDNLLKSQFNDEINRAIADKRIHFSHATNGLDIGTMIVIDPKVDKDGKPISGDYNNPRRFFVKDLFKSSAENSLRDRTEIVAQMQYAKHQTYKHIYRGSDFTINDWDSTTDSAIYTDSNNVSRRLNKAEILNILDDDAICKRITEYYEDANLVDDNGNGYTKQYFNVYKGRGFNLTDLYNHIQANCTMAMKEKYKGETETYIKHKAQKLMNNIFKKLNIKFSVESEQTPDLNI